MVQHRAHDTCHDVLCWHHRPACGPAAAVAAMLRGTVKVTSALLSVIMTASRAAFTVPVANVTLVMLQGGSPREGSSLRGMSPDAPALSWNAQNRTASAAGVYFPYHLLSSRQTCTGNDGPQSGPTLRVEQTTAIDNAGLETLSQTPSLARPQTRPTPNPGTSQQTVQLAGSVSMLANDPDRDSGATA